MKQELEIRAVMDTTDEEKWAVLLDVIEQLRDRGIAARIREVRNAEER